jgi:hypothetical protein
MEYRKGGVAGIVVDLNAGLMSRGESKIFRQVALVEKRLVTEIDRRPRCVESRTFEEPEVERKYSSRLPAKSGFSPVSRWR